MREVGVIPKLPVAGAVLGIDVGFSATRASSAVCRLDWDAVRITWAIRRFRAVPAEQEAAVRAIAGDVWLAAAAFDGPLRAGLEVIGRYRVAERMLTRRLQSKIGKPGQASAPVGKALNTAANHCAALVIKACQLAPATHAVRIDRKAIVEAFPSAFLGVMLRDPSTVTAERGDRSDVFFQHLTDRGALQLLLQHLLPDRNLKQSLNGVVNHDDRAALICALTALAIAADDYTAVGDNDGWIILPPRRFVRSWARSDLEANAREEKPGCWYQTVSLSSA
jgi:hypothetical protein